MEAEFDISISDTFRRLWELPALMRLLLVIYGIAFVSFQLWFIWFLNSVQ